MGGGEGEKMLRGRLVSRACFPYLGVGGAASWHSSKADC